MAKVELKAPIVDEISGHLNGAQGVVLVDYRGLTVEQDTQLRKQLREAGVVYKVYKNTLVKRAIAGTEFEPMTDMLEGPTAIAICTTDATAPARILSNFARVFWGLLPLSIPLKALTVNTRTPRASSRCKGQG